jgi:hypothetical protein
MSRLALLKISSLPRLAAPGNGIRGAATGARTPRSGFPTGFASAVKRVWLTGADSGAFEARVP